MISEGQRNDINFAIPVLEHVTLDGCNVLADRGYNSDELIDYIYEHGAEPTIPSKKNAKYERHCDWWLYKERHLVEKLFLKLRVSAELQHGMINTPSLIWGSYVLP